MKTICALEGIVECDKSLVSLSKATVSFIHEERKWGRVSTFDGADGYAITGQDALTRPNSAYGSKTDSMSRPTSAYGS
jgi:hypothetical protein